MSQPDSHAAILEAAAIEFAERGFEGVRMEHVARRAGYNKALVYRHFGDKRGLFDEALRRCFRQREALLNRLPPSLAEAMLFWSRAQAEDSDFLILMLREALQDDGSEPVEAEARVAYYKRQVAALKELQDAGEVDEELDPEMTLLALLGVTVIPTMLPQIARLATGDAPGSEAFIDRWEQTLARMALLLAPRIMPPS